MLNDAVRLISSSPVRHLDIVTMLKYAETDERGKATEKAFVQVSTSFSLYVINK